MNEDGRKLEEIQAMSRNHHLLSLGTHVTSLFARRISIWDKTRKVERPPVHKSQLESMVFQYAGSQEKKRCLCFVFFTFISAQHFILVHPLMSGLGVAAANRLKYNRTMHGCYENMIYAC